MLVICTGNLCRSPQAAALLRSRIPSALGNWGTTELQVASAGTSASSDLPIDAHAAQELERLGIVVDDAHRSRQVSRSLLVRADLVLTMTTCHEAEVASLGRHRVAGRLFTLVGFTVLAEALAEARSVPAPTRDVPFALFMQRVVAAAVAADQVPSPPVVEIDIPDPRGFGVAAHRQSADLIDAQVRRLAGALRSIAQPGSDPEASAVVR